MLFRTNNGELIEIKKYDFTSDKLYYEKIMSIQKKSSKIEKIHNIYNHALKDKNNKQPNK
jgi:hypothetical protein